MRVIRRIKTQKVIRELLSLSDIQKTRYGLLALAFIGLGIFLCIVMVSRSSQVFSWELLVMPVFYFCSLPIVFYLLTQNKLQQKEIQMLLHYQQGVMDIYTESNVFKHNYKNALIVLMGCCQEKDYEQLGRYLEGLVKDFSHTYEKEHYDAIEKVQSPALKWLLIAKAIMAQKLGIQFSVVISDQFSCVCLNENEFCTVLGNIIDNAIDAAAESCEKQIKLFLLKKDNEVYLSIQNTVLREPDMARMFDKGYSTKKEHTGLGLYSIKNILSHYMGAVMDVKMEGTFFTVDISLPSRE